MTRILFYADKGTTYEITDVMMYSGNPTAISTMTVTFNGNEVAMTKSVTTNIRETNKQRIHNPATILFKLPPAEGTVSWSSDDTVGDKIKYTASWTVTNVDGKELKTIMVEKEVEGFGHVSIEYYVQGIGLYKTDLKSSDGKLQAFESFDELIHDPTVK